MTGVENSSSEDDNTAIVEGSVIAESPDLTTPSPEASSDTPLDRRRRVGAARILAFWVLPVLLLLLAAGVGYLKWFSVTAQSAEAARAETVRAASAATTAILTYRADTVEQDLGRATALLTGEFKDSYTSLTREVVIPGSKAKHISATATVAAAAPVTVSGTHAVVLLFVNQTTTIGTDAPSDSTSSVRVTVQKVDDRWLISRFEPV